MASTIKVNPIRLRSSGTLVMFENPPTTAMFGPSESSRGFGRWRGRRDHDGLPLGLLYLLGGLLAEGVRDDRELLGELAFPENLDPHVATLHEPRIAERLFVHGGAAAEPLELSDVEHDGFDRKRHAKAALRHAALNRRLPALEMHLVEVSRLPRLLTLHALAARLADAAAGAAAEAACRMTRARRR